jgi:glyoxalase family protein
LRRASARPWRSEYSRQGELKFAQAEARPTSEMLLGFHHVTAIAGDPQRNLDFYTGVMGMRLVKRTVNFDDPATHHFYYGDSQGSLGTLLTFFPWVTSMRRARRGPGQIVAVAFQTGSLNSWKSADFETRLGERILVLRDPADLRLELVESSISSRLGALHSITITDTRTSSAAEFLRTVLGFEPVAEENGRARFELPGRQIRIDVLPAPDGERGLSAPGSIHHVALRVRNEEDQDKWRARLIEAGLKVTLPQDRKYFRSIYFRQPGGVLFELATSSPGFTVDEPLDDLGTSLCLPPWLESARGSIESRLAKIAIPAPVEGHV